MAKFKQKAHQIPEKQNTGPNKDHFNPRNKRGNPTSGGKIFGNWYKGKKK